MIGYDDEQFNPPAPALMVEVYGLFSKITMKLKGKIDTGADITVIPAKIVRDLNLLPVRIIKTRGYNGKISLKPMYLVNISIKEFKFDLVEVIAARREDILIGRNILNQLTIKLNGKQLNFEILDC